jgi:hypothetical protein
MRMIDAPPPEGDHERSEPVYTACVRTKAPATEATDRMSGEMRRRPPIEAAAVFATTTRYADPGGQRLSNEVRLANIRPARSAWRPG